VQQWRQCGGSVAAEQGRRRQWRQLGIGSGSMAGTATVAAWRRQQRWQRRQQQWQRGGGGQLGGRGGSLADARLWRWRQCFGKCGGSVAAAATVQQRQWQLCGGRQLGDGGGSLAAAAWRQRGCGGCSGSMVAAAAARPQWVAWQRRRQHGGSAAAAAAAWRQHCHGSSSSSAAVAATVLQWRAAWWRRRQLDTAAWRQRGLSSRLLLVDCCLFLPPPLLLPKVSPSPPYLSLDSKMGKNPLLKLFFINIFQTEIICCLIECFHGDNV
jgi:hypothetical protein